MLQFFCTPLHARIDKPKTAYLHLVSVEAGVWLSLYATAGRMASHVSRTIDESWSQGARINEQVRYLARFVDVGFSACEMHTQSPLRRALNYVG